MGQILHPVASSILVWLAAAPTTSDTVSFVETGVAELRLMDPASTRRLFARLGRPKAIDDGLIHRTLATGPGETMDLVFHPGDLADSVSEVTIAFRTERGPGTIPSRRGVVTSRGIRLGMKRSDAERILGRPTSVKAQGSHVVLHYSCDDPGQCPALAEHNMPEYEAELTCDHGIVKQYSFGFPYP